ELAPEGTPLDVRLLGTARLRGWALVFDLFSASHQSRVADIVEADDAAEVWGALYELSTELVIRSDGERSVLDRIEGHRTERDPENYRPMEINVEVDGVDEASYVYVGIDDARARCGDMHPLAQVSPEYASVVLEGAAAVGLPVAYVDRLEELLA